jgi:hypothetical protein
MDWVDTKFEEPEIIAFARLDHIGDFIEGVFAGTEERQNNFGRKEVHIKIRTGDGPDGEAVLESLRANQRLLAQVASVKRGSMVRIEYVEDRPNDGVDREGRPLSPTKLYRVQVANGVAAQRPAQQSNANDIPF